ncbi:MAG: hypothetical protein HY376_03300 [Candidatus Blackburnbacteria bacterium]|nr:hypothetical protein [Candidatus Blackburnbacteria bacterium]
MKLTITGKLRIEEMFKVESNPNFLGKMPKDYCVKLLNIGSEVEPKDYWFELILKRRGKAIPLKFDKEDGEVVVSLIIEQKEAVA